MPPLPPVTNAIRPSRRPTATRPSRLVLKPGTPEQVKNGPGVLPVMEASRDGDGTCIARLGPLRSIGVARFLVCGTSGGWEVPVREAAAVGGDRLPIKVLPATSCRRAGV